MDENAIKSVIIRAIEGYYEGKRCVTQERTTEGIQDQERRRQEELDAHSQTREHGPRRQVVTVTDGLEKLEYQLESLDEYGGAEDIFRPIPTETNHGGPTDRISSTDS